MAIKVYTYDGSSTYADGAEVWSRPTKRLMLAVPLTPIAASWSYLEGVCGGAKGREGERREDTEK